MIKKIFGVAILLLLLSPAIMYLLWFFSPEKKLNVLILDKTVLESKTQEHVSLSWLLTNEKYYHNVTVPHNPKTDYFGFFPNDSGLYKIKDFNAFSNKSLDSLASSYDMAYYTDLYGIYDGEWYEKYPNVSPIKNNGIDNSMEHTERIYGGMTPSEFLLLQKMKAQNKLIIAEFNVIASPTANNVRREFENEFGMQWTGWVGRYYETLDTLINKELPRWLKRNYLAQHKRKWPFHKSGIVFVREDDKVEILENTTHLDIELPIIQTSDNFIKKYNLPAEMKYPFWFDIVRTSSKNEIVSNYKLSPNPLGKALLKQYGIPETFPAAIEHDSADYKFHYFAGDFCDNPIGLKSAKFKWIEYFSIFSYQASAQERISFFWDYYRPMMKEILSSYSKENVNHQKQ